MSRCYLCVTLNTKTGSSGGRNLPYNPIKYGRDDWIRTSDPLTPSSAVTRPHTSSSVCSVEITGIGIHWGPFRPRASIGLKLYFELRAHCNFQALVRKLYRLIQRLKVRQPARHEITRRLLRERTTPRVSRRDEGVGFGIRHRHTSGRKQTRRQTDRG